MSRVAQAGLVGTLVVTVLVLWIVLFRTIITPPDPIVFTSASIPDPVVSPGQHLTMRVTADVRESSDCIFATQRYLRFSDGSEARVPGTRRTFGNRHQTIFYDLVVPISAPLGRATLRVRENFSCGSTVPAETAALAFEIRR